MFPLTTLVVSLLLRWHLLISSSRILLSLSIRRDSSTFGISEDIPISLLSPVTEESVTIRSKLSFLYQKVHSLTRHRYPLALVLFASFIQTNDKLNWYHVMCTLQNYFGNPYSSCQPECYGDVDCPSHKPACFYGICKSPCEGSCGVGANCELRGLTPVCSCPKDMTGDPFIRCRPFEARKYSDQIACMRTGISQLVPRASVS